MQNIGPDNRPGEITPLLALVTALCGQKCMDIRDRPIIAFSGIFLEIKETETPYLRTMLNCNLCVKTLEKVYLL